MVTLSAITGNDKVNFSGAWSLNETKSDLGEGRRGRVALKMTISQTVDSLVIERLSKRRSGEKSLTPRPKNHPGKLNSSVTPSPVPPGMNTLCPAARR